MSTCRIAVIPATASARKSCPSAEAAASGRVAAAGLDVFNNKPAIYPGYAALPDLFMLPHIGTPVKKPAGR